MKTIRWGDKRLPERFWAKTQVNLQTGCWEWTAFLDEDGYGRFRFPGLVTRQAHRGAYLTLVGPINEETLNHDCNVRRCVNPNTGHAATPISSADNVRDGKARITHCPNNHPYDKQNTMMVGPNKDRRACRACYNERSRNYWHGKRKDSEKAARRAAGYRGGVAETATCKRSHPRTPENTYVMPNGYKTCKVCRNERTAEYNARKRTKAK